MSINNLNTYLNIKDSHLRVVSGNVYAQAMNIGGINVETAHGLQSVSDTGNVTSNTLQFSNAITGFVTTANAQIGRDLIVSGNATVSTDLTVSANATVADTLTISEHLIASKEATVTGNLHVTTIRSDSNVVAEYTGPHDRPLRKYPEVALSVTSESASGEHGYKVSWSSIYDSGNSAGERPFNAFNGDIGNGGVAWMVDSGVYGSDGTYAYNPPRNLGTATGGNSTTVNGEYIILQTPNRIKVKHFRISDRSTNTDRAAEAGKLYGSNDGSTWYELASFSELTYYDGDYFNTVHVNATTYYDRLALVVTNSTATSSSTFMGIGELEYYGHEEGSASLDTTLKTVYNVPATTGTQLEVYYDAKETSSYPESGVTVTDLSGKGVTGTLTAQGGFENVDNIKAFTSSGSTTHALTATTSLSGSPVMTISAWVKFDSFASSSSIIYLLGNSSVNNEQVWLGTQSNGSIWTLANGGAGAYNQYSSNDSPVLNSWIHVAAIYSGGTYPEGLSLYINGKLLTPTVINGSGVSLTLPSNSPLYLGWFGSGTSFFGGSIANFRLYSKALNADQIKELYDYQKDYFLGSKSQVTLYKGHLGVGVTEPSGQLELAGDERIQEYPPRDLGGFETLVEGQGTYKVSSSSDVTNPSLGGNDHPATAFTANDTFFRGIINDYGYNTGSPAPYVGIHFTNGIGGDFLQIELPYKIYLKSINITARTSSSLIDRAPYTGFIFGSNDSGTTWSQVTSWNGLTWTVGESKSIQINSNTLYSTYRLVANKLLNSTASASRFNIDRWQLFGTPGPTTLDKGSLTLGRSLDVPRVSRYDVDTETPRPEKLVVDFDTTVNSSPTDISGKGNHGKFSDASGVPAYSAADKAFDFDGVNGVIYVPLLSPAMTGDRICSMSAWFKTTNASTVNQQIVWLGAYSVAGLLAVAVSNGTLRISIGSGCSLDVAGVIESNTWYHVVGIKQGTGSITSSNFSSVFKLYLNGEPMTGTFGGTARTLNVTTNYWYVGAGNSTGAEAFSGYISNPKLYDTILEASEVKKLYRLGRTGRSMVISDTAVGIGKAPEAQLDVRGLIKAAAMHVPGTVVQVITKYNGSQLSYTSSGGNPVEMGWAAQTIYPKFGNSKMIFQAWMTGEGNYNAVIWVEANGVDIPIGISPAYGSQRGIIPVPFDNNTDSTPNSFTLMTEHTISSSAPITYRMYYDHNGTGTIKLNRAYTAVDERGICYTMITEVAQ
jgi:hypothetical protein